MIYVGVILSLLLVLYWFLKIESAVVFAPVVSCGVLKSKTFNSSMLIVVLVTLSLMGCKYIPVIGSRDLFSSFSDISIIISAFAACITMLIVSQISKFSSVCYAFIGALIGCKVFLAGGRQMWNYDIRVFVSWIVAPLIAMALAAVIYIIYTATIGKLKVHIIKFSCVMKYFLLFESILLAVAFTINNGALLSIISGVAGNIYGSTAIVIISAAAFFVVMQHKISDKINLLIDREYDINYPVAMSIILSTAIVLLLFSSDHITKFAGLKATPLSIASLMFLSLMGIGFVQNREKIEQQTFWRLLISIIVTPIIAVIISYVLCYVIGLENISVKESFAVNPERIDINFILFISVAFIGGIVLFFINYQQKVKDNEKIKALSQQQQVDENQRSVNAIEVKTILAENQNLHNRLEQKRKELIDVALNINEQKDFLETVYGKIKETGTFSSQEKKDSAIKEVEQMLFQRMLFTQEIDSFYTQAEVLHKDFSLKLQEKFPNLTEHERRLATLLRLGFSTKEIASLMNISIKSAEINRYRLRKKLDISRKDNLIQFIKSL